MMPLIVTLTAEQTNSATYDEPTIPTEETLTNPEPIDMRSITVISRQLPAIEAAKTRIHAEMENMVLSGLETLVSPPLSFSLRNS